MPRAAVALASPTAHARTRAVDADLERQLERLGRRVSPGPRFRPRRLHLGLLILALVAVWVAAVFARSLTDLDQATSRQAAVAAESAALQQRLDADRRELALVQTDAFQALQARSYGLGRPGEMVFSLPADAPSPAPIVALGASTSTPASQTPLDTWLNLLFGH